MSDDTRHSPEPERVRAGQAVYSRRVLALYDWFVLGFSNRFVWRCPTAKLVRLYDANVSANHLDIGVGTGYFLDRCRFPSPRPRLVLMDLNPNCLAATAHRVRRFAPETVVANVLDPIAYRGEPFDSIGLNFVLHCLPGTIPAKSAVFDHLLPLLKPGGVVFGSTLLGVRVRSGFLARRLSRMYNRRGIFSNGEDSRADLETALAARFRDVTIDTVGCAALFTARLK
jgi:ubiquinone/menaquinone biosynthesis C-methylase UbiE